MKNRDGLRGSEVEEVREFQIPIIDGNHKMTVKI